MSLNLLIVIAAAVTLIVAPSCGTATTPASQERDAATTAPQESAGNGLIAFAGWESHVDSSIRVVRPDGSGLRSLTRARVQCSLARCGGQDPDWSPNGARIAYVKSNRHRGLYVLSPGSGRVKAVVYADAYEPDWSPYGTKIVASGLSGIYIVGSNGERPTTIVEGGDSTYMDPAWSPRGATILYVTNNPYAHQRYCGYDAHIYATNTKGTERTRLTDEGANLRPAWSPDGRRIAFLNIRGKRIRIMIMNADGSNKRPIATIQPPCTQLGLAWSPDGQRLAYVDKGRTIWTMRPDGTGRRRVTPGGGRLSWQPIPRRS